MGERHRRDEQLLEARLGRRLDLLDAQHRRLHLPTGRRRQQGHHRPGTGGIAHGADAVERAVGNEPEDHRVQRVDVCSERAGEPDVGDGRVAGVLEQQVDTGAERGFGELHRPHVVLRDRKLGAVVAVEDVAVRPPVGHDPVGS